MHRYELIRGKKEIEDLSECDVMNEPFSMILKKHLPQLNQIRPSSGVLNLNTKKTNFLSKIILSKPLYSSINKNDVKSAIRKYLQPWNWLLGSANEIRDFILSRHQPVHQYHCFIFLKLYLQTITKTIGPSDFLRLLDLLALTIHQYITAYPLPREFVPDVFTEWNKKYLYPQYRKNDNGELIRIRTDDTKNKQPL